jgi:hypothetical protein
MDFMSDALANGQKLRVLTVVCAYTRECVALERGTQFRGADVAGYPPFGKMPISGGDSFLLAPALLPAARATRPYLRYVGAVHASGRAALAMDREHPIRRDTALRGQ